jgi:tRNA(Arg) A34 adenosine deaminase TadA
MLTFNRSLNVYVALEPCDMCPHDGLGLQVPATAFTSQLERQHAQDACR